MLYLHSRNTKCVRSISLANKNAEFGVCHSRKSGKLEETKPRIVIPAQAGIQKASKNIVFICPLDSRLRGNDSITHFRIFKWNGYKGAVLISALLFMVILSLLVLSVLKTSLLESKMSHYFNNKNLSFIAAENLLQKEERGLKNGIMPKNAELISDRVCGVTFYRVLATGKSGKITTTLQSTYAKVGDTSKCDPKPIIETGRQSWREID